MPKKANDLELKKTETLTKKSTNSTTKKTTKTTAKTKKAAASTTKKKTKTKKPVEKVATKKTSVAKKTTAKKTTAKKTTTKKATKTTKKVVKALTKDSIESTEKKSSTISGETFSIAEYYDLPYRYNQTVVKLLYQTPTTLFIYWDISDEDREKLKETYGEDFLKKQSLYF